MDGIQTFDLCWVSAYYRMMFDKKVWGNFDGNHSNYYQEFLQKIIM